MGCCCPSGQLNIPCHPYYPEYSSSYLGDGLVVDADEVAGRGVDLEGLVESESGIDGLGGCLRTECC